MTKAIQDTDIHDEVFRWETIEVYQKGLNILIFHLCYSIRLKRYIITVVAIVNKDILTLVWKESDKPFETCCGAHMEQLLEQ